MQKKNGRIWIGIAALVLVALAVAIWRLPGRETESEAALQAYSEFVARQLEDPWLEPEQLRFGLDHVDGDDVPELMLCDGDYHANGVEIYSYDGASGEVVAWGTFGEFGATQYCSGQGIVIDCGGNMGFFTTIYHQGGPKGIEKVLAVGTEDYSQERPRLFWQEAGDRAHWGLGEDDFVFNQTTAVTEEEYAQREAAFRANLVEESVVDYKTMRPVTPEALSEEYRLLGGRDSFDS